MYPKIKRVLDLFIALIMTLVLFPIIALVYMLNYFLLRENPLFTQTRIGYKNQSFKIYKFKSMNNKRGDDGNLLSDEERLTSFGIIMRKLSLDELPQLWNVLKGEMSFVGPRPLLPEYLPLYSQEQIKRHDVIPGITGWAQVNGRNAISWQQKFKYDVYYVSNQSLQLDIKIMYLTLAKVFNTKDVSSESSVTMEKFEGNND
jgi:lipopolysaccharide/colanic/teichoic acid biosynthesis glycosyltransferase